MHLSTKDTFLVVIQYFLETFPVNVWLAKETGGTRDCKAGAEFFMKI